MKEGVVYAIKYLPEDKIIYIGCTTWFTRRIYQHSLLREGKRTQPIQAYINEKGFENFKFIKLHEQLVNKVDELYEVEMDFIKKYKTYSNGFNRNKGGNETAPDKLNPNARKVRCLNTGEVFDTAKSVCDKYGFLFSEFSSHLTKSRYLNGIGKRKFGEALFFEYVDREKDNRQLSNDIRKKMSERASKNNKKKIKNLDTGEVYETVREASLKLNINYTTLSSLLNGNERIANRENLKNLNLVFI